MDIRARRSRESSPDRAKVVHQPKITKPTFRKVQVLYYLSRNGQLEHPHFMEISHFADQQLRLKDVVDRLTVLRGRGMPSLFSWSCKRGYKNGFVWNDLAENDVIYPTQGAEYVLKGSEIIEGCAERFQHLRVRNQKQNPEAKFQSKERYRNREEEVEEEPLEDGEEEEEEEEEKGSNSSSNTPHSRCSRGVSTDEMEENENPKTQNNATELTLDDGSPPSSSSTTSERTQNGNSKRFEDSDSGGGDEPVATRNSVLLQLIACGSAAATKECRNSGALKQSNGGGARKSNGGSLHKGVLCKTAAKTTAIEDDINYMSENPRFGNLQSEEKEYFSGSIVESMKESSRGANEPVLKKSSSYNEERSMKAEIGNVVEKVEEKNLKGKCIPMKISSCKQHRKG